METTQYNTEALSAAEKRLTFNVLPLTADRLNKGESPCLGFFSGTVIFRLENPKPKRKPDGTVSNVTTTKAGTATRRKFANAKTVKPLSHEEKCDVVQTCAAVLCTLGEFYNESPSSEAWLAAFKSCRKSLQRNNSAKETLGKSGSADDTIGAYRAALDASLSPEETAEIRNRIARRVKYWHSCLLAALQVSESRKKKSEFKGALSTLRALCEGGMRNRSGLSDKERAALAMKLRRFHAYIASGENALDAEAEAAIAKRQAEKDGNPVSVAEALQIAMR
jgi:hypothetical protein